MKTITAIHTTTAMVEPTKQLFAKHFPDVRLVHIADNQLIQEVIKEGKVTAEVEKRLISYYRAAIAVGTDVIFNTCSSVGEVVIKAKELIDIPLIKIDDAMAEKAVNNYAKIGVLATLPSTLNPTVRLLQHFAQKQGKTIHIEEGLAKGVFQAMVNGDKATHDQKIMRVAKIMVDKVDCIVLAQGSMARMDKDLADKTGLSVLSSPELGVLQLKELITKIPCKDR